MHDYRQEVDNEKYYKARLYTFPDAQASQTVFEFDDLTPDQMVILCVRAQPDKEDRENDVMFIWTGEDFEQSEEYDEEEVEKFIS